MEHFEHVSRSPFLPGAQVTAEFRELRIRSDLPGQRSSIILCQFVTLSAHASTQTGRNFRLPSFPVLVMVGVITALPFHPGAA